MPNHDYYLLQMVCVQKSMESGKIKWKTMVQKSFFFLLGCCHCCFLSDWERFWEAQVMQNTQIFTQIIFKLVCPRVHYLHIGQYTWNEWPKKRDS